ncbi:conjugal transfer protein TraV [Sphingomonas sp. ABOLE]|jgi:conjugal transfer pilus assembly protein TraV|nr:conjugal transfer protein TraV [Sphingomonas sp. ABOLE]
MGVVGLAALSGCTTFGGNVKGNFSCSAPDGICAPSSSIDDRALAMIADSAGSSELSPAGGSQAQEPTARVPRKASAVQPLPLGQADARRTQERVLRIVFQPYIDDRGRLHEASAVHAVVQRGEWHQEVVANSTSLPDRNAMRAPAPAESLADAVNRADQGSVAFAVDPDLPDPAAVAAARARAVDPVAAIKSEVAARLAPKAGRTPRAAPGAEGVATPQPAALAPKASSDVGKGKVGAAGRPEKQAPPANAATAIAAADEPLAPAGSPPVPKPTVRAPGFPSAGPEDN